jgi:hypothetical protein
MKKYLNILTLLTLLLIGLSSCSKESNGGLSLSFSRSIYILPASSSLEIELRASVAPEQDLEVPIQLTGSAIKDKDYTISAEKFIIKAGETKATLVITPKDNLTEGQEIRVSIAPSEKYSLGSKNIAMIPVEAKEKIMYSFYTANGRLLSDINVTVQLKGEITGTSFRASEDIHIPFEILDGGTAIQGKQFEIKAGAKEFVIPAGDNKATINIKIPDGGAGDNPTGKYFTLKLKSPTQNSEFYFLGSYATFKCVLSQLKFSDLVGKWKPVGITNKDAFVALEIPEAEYVGLLPEKNGASDYLEFVSDGQGDRIIPHLTGDLKNFFCGAEHTVVFDHVEKGFLDFSTWAELDIPYFKIAGVNKLFSATKNSLATVFIGFDQIDEDNINIYFHEYVPTDFFSITYDSYGFDPTYFGLTYKFTRADK